MCLTTSSNSVRIEGTCGVAALIAIAQTDESPKEVLHPLQARLLTGTLKNRRFPWASQKWAEHPQLESTIAIGRMRLDEQGWKLGPGAHSNESKLLLRCHSGSHGGSAAVRAKSGFEQR